MCEVCLQETSARLSHSELVVAAPSSSSDTIVSRVSSAVKSLKLGDTAVKVLTWEGLAAGTVLGGGPGAGITR